jgi:hypothetical protein
MTLLGPFPQPRPELKRQGLIEHVVYGPVKAVVYATMPFADERVQLAISAYFAKAVEQATAKADDETWRSSTAIAQLQRSVARARHERQSSGLWWKR